MTLQAIEQPGRADLRLRAHERLTGRKDAAGVPVTASAALGVLHALASSPSTAADALALLHELQVHQVELDLQAEEMSGRLADLEAALRRQVELYDSVPAGLLTVDAEGVIHDVNLTGSGLLGPPGDALLGRSLGSFLAAHSARSLLAMLGRVAGGGGAEGGSLELAHGRSPSHVVQARVSADPAGGLFLVAVLDLRNHS